MNNTGIVIDNRFFDHRIEKNSLENPNRLQRLFPLIKKEYKSSLRIVPPREAMWEDIERVHSNFYLQQVREHALNTDPYSYDKDTYLMDFSLTTAQLAAGGCLELADRIMSGDLHQGFALIRPPGHHAEQGRGMGFCILNNIAITAAYLKKCYGVGRIMIIDFDIHHGNGTQETFFESDNVLFCSIHQESIFPFSGNTSEIGSGKGAGYTINIPVHSQFGDEEYIFLLGKMLQSVAEQYMPEIILVSAGYDGHEADPISATLLSTQGYAKLTTLLKQCAAEICNQRLLFILEGGYNPLSLEESVLSTLDSMLQDAVPRIGIFHSKRAALLFDGHPLHEFWTL